MLAAQRPQPLHTAVCHHKLTHSVSARLPRRQMPCRGTHRFSLQAHYDVFVKADPTDPAKLGDCPFSHRVLLALEEKKADYERHLVDLKHKPDWFLKMTEKGSTPVLKINEEDKVITDSAEILEYLDDKIAEPHLGSPSDIPESGKDLLPTFVRYIGATGPDSHKQLTALRSVLEELNSHFKSHGRFINGSEITAGDCVVAPLLYQVEIVCNQLKEVDLFMAMNGIAKYNDNIRSRDSWKHTQYSQEAVIAGWKPKVA